MRPLIRYSLLSCPDVELQTPLLFSDNYRNIYQKKENLYFADLEKACNRVPRDGVWWGLSKLGVEDWLVKTVQSDNV